jgi:peptidyl-dipeptidase Dcp
MIEAAFFTAERLFGLRFTERPDVPVYHPGVRVWEVRDADGRSRGLFYGDYLARPGKRGGSWMSALRDPQKLSDELPIVLNVTNFAAAAPTEPVLLTFEDANSVFHEFGHALHALLSDVTYPLIAGTNVAGDFAEFPAQLYEHWLEVPEILARFAVHYRTGEPMPKPLLDQVLAARKDGQAFAMLEYLASAYADLDAHLLTSTAGLDVAGFERAELPRIGMPPEIGMLHRMPHFGHAFGGDGYAAGYYGYLWSEVLDTDGFRAFQEAEDVFDPALAARLRTFVFAAGALRDPAEAYERFRGRPPSIDALLDKRGFAGGCRATTSAGQLRHADWRAAPR